MAGEGIVLNLLEKTSFLIVILILMSKIKILKNILKSEQNNKRNLIIISGVFSFLAIVGTYLGIDVDGSMANVRNIAIVSGGMLFGPIVGVTAGIIAGVHRFLIDINGITAIPCFLTSVLAGVLSGYLCNRVDSDKKWVVGIMSMEIILILSRPYDIAVSIVRHIYIPMMIGQVGIGFLISILQSLRREKEEIAAQQAKLSLDIANKTLPYFRNMNKN